MKSEQFIFIFLQIVALCRSAEQYQEGFHHYQFRQLITTDQCDIKCKHCDQATPKLCLQCNDTSNRKLVGDQCVCNDQFLETNQANCVACPTNCKICTSINTCTECLPNMYSFQGLCYTSCPQNTYLIPSSFLCQNYLQYTLQQERDNQNRIILTFKFNYPLKTTSNPTSLIVFKIKEDPNFAVVSIIPLVSTSVDELKVLYLPRNSIVSTTLLITSFDNVDLVSKDNNIPIIQVDPKNPISINMGAFLKPQNASSLDNMKQASNFLYDKSSVSYEVFYVLRCLAFFVHLFPALQFVMVLCYMQVFRTPYFYYLIKLIGGFGINQLPDWQLYDTYSAQDKFGDDFMPFLYYIIQLAAAYLIFGIVKWVYEIYKKQELDHISQFQTVLKIHIWSINILQHVHQVLLFYLVYYSIFILMHSGVSTSREIFFFVLAVVVLVYQVIYLIIGSYRLSINSFHFFINYVKDIEDQQLKQRFYLFGMGNIRKILIVIMVCTLYSTKSIIMSAIALSIYFIAFSYTVLTRPYSSTSLLIIKYIEELSQLGLFSAILAGQILYDEEDFSSLSSESSYYDLDYACLAFLAIFIFMNLLKQLTSLKHLLYKNESTKRTITYLHKFDDHYQDPISANNPISKNQLLLDQSINNISQSGNKLPQQNLQQSRRNILQSQRINQQSAIKNQVADEDKINGQDNVQIEMNNIKSLNYLTNPIHKNITNTNNNPQITEEKTKFQKAVEHTKMLNQVANQFQSSKQQDNQNRQYQPNPISNMYLKKNVQGQNQFKKTDNGYALQYTLRELYGGQNPQNMFSNKGQQMYNSKQKGKVPTIGMIMEQKKMNQNAEQINNYFNSVYKKQNPIDQIAQQQNRVQNYGSIEKNNFQSNSMQQQNHPNQNNFIVVNPYLQNQTKQNQNLEFIKEEEDPKQYTNSQVNGSNDHQQYQNYQMNEQDGHTNQIKFNHNQDNNYNDENNDYHKIDQEYYANNNYLANQQLKNNHADDDSYNGGESIDLSELQMKENQLKSILQQSIKSKTLDNQNEMSKQQQNEKDNFQVFFHSKLKDNSIQFIQEEMNEQDISPQNDNYKQELMNKKQSEILKNDDGQKGGNKGKQKGNNDDLSLAENYASPEFRKISNQSQQSQQLKLSTKQTVKQS